MDEVMIKSSYDQVCINSSPAIMPLAALYFGLLFLKGRFSLKNWTQKVILRHNTTSFKRTRFLIKLKVLPWGLYVLNGIPNRPVLNNNRKTTVWVETTQKRLAQRSFLFNILSAIHSQNLKFWNGLNSLENESLNAWKIWIELSPGQK
jgi:hypothetical protein